MGEMVRGLAKALIVLGVIVIGFTLFSRRKSSLEDIDGIEYKYIEKDAIKEEDIKEDFKYLYEKVNYELLQDNFGSEFFNIYYNNDNFSNDLYIAVINLIKDKTKIKCNIEKEINKVEIYSKIKEIFGDNIKFVDKTYENNNISIKYDEKTSTYHIKTNKCSEYDYKNGGIREEYVKTSKIGNSLNIYVKVMYIDYSNDENGALLFNYHQWITKDDKILSNDLSTIDKDILPTYKYIFEINKNNYNFKQVERVN